MPTTRSVPAPLTMDRTLAVWLGAKYIPFKGNKPLPLQPPRPTFIIQVGPVSDKRSWLYWELQKGVEDA